MPPFLANPVRAFSAALLAVACVASSGCAVIDTPPRCSCSKCQHATIGGGDVLADLARTVDELVIGADFQEPLATENKAAPMAEAEEIAPRTIDLHGPLSELPEPIAMPETGEPSSPMASDNVTAPPAGACTPASHTVVEPALEAGPPPRFFPVPARPVFSTTPTSCWLR